MRRAVALAAAAALIALVGAVCGIGGGLFAVPLLHYAFGLGLRSSVATSLALVLATGLAATTTELLHPAGALRWGAALPLIAGALVGAKLGYLVSKRLPDVGLKALFLVAMGAAGLRMWLVPAGPDAPALGAGDLELGRALAVAGVGVLAGMVAPLLGIGGGLVAVPGLLLLAPELGSLGARAASLAMTVPNAARSLALYGKEPGVIDRRAAWPFAAGALVGGALGVRLVHVPGMVRIGQLALGGILLFTAARFGLDVARWARRGPLGGLRRP